MPQWPEHRPRGAALSAPAASPDVRLGGRWTLAQAAKNHLIYAVATAALTLARALPTSALRATCRTLGALVCLLWPSGRRRAQASLDASLGEGHLTARDVFEGLGELLADTLSLLDDRPVDPARLRLDEASRATLEAALTERRGVVLVTAHLGPWERLAAVLVSEGFPLCAIARRSYDPRFDAIYERLRQRRGLEVAYRGDPGLGPTIARWLEGNRIAGFLVDLPGRGVDAREVPFLGGALRLAAGPARLALARRAPLVVATPVADTSPPLLEIERIETSDLGPDEQGEATLVDRYARALARRVARSPRWWPWFELRPR